MTVIGELAVNAVVRTGGVSRGARTFRQEVSGMEAFARRAGPAIAGIGAAAVGAFALVSDRAKKFDELVNSADRLGVGVERLQELNYAAGQTSNVTNMVSTLGNLEKRTSEAARGIGKAQTAIRELNLDARQLSSLPVDEQLFRIADAMRDVGNAGDQTRLAARLGIDAELLTMLNQGRSGIEGVMEEARKMGVILDEANARSLANTNDQLDQMYAKANAAGDALAGAFAPGVGVAADTAGFFAGMVQGLQDYAERATLAMYGQSPEANRAQERILAQDAAARRADAARFKRDIELGNMERQRDAERQVQQAKALEERKAQAIKSARASLRSRLGDARNQVETFGMTPIQSQIHDLKSDRTADTGLRDKLVGQLETLQKLEAARERNIDAQEREQALQQRAASIIQAQVTPLDRLRSQLAEIVELRTAGQLTAEQAARATGRANRDFKASVGDGASPERSNALVKFGSAEAFRAIRESRQADKPNKVDEKQLKELEQANALAKETITAIVAIGRGGPVANWP